MLAIPNTVFVLIDVQGKLAEVMFEKEALWDNLDRLVKGMQALQVPIFWLEQIPAKMGETIRPLRKLLQAGSPIEKSAFSCCREPRFMEALAACGRRQALLAGIEAHVCVYQTAAHLVEAGYEVEVVADAVSSRTNANKELALQKIRDHGARVTCVETCLFELLGDAQNPAFRQVLSLVR